MLPRRGTSDYDEDEATSLDPFSIQESELVVVPKAAGTDAIHEDLRADPDVQDALRWLDPPSNAGPAAAAAAAVAAEQRQPDVIVPMPGPAPYGQVYTPVPQPYPGAGPYPTPVPSYVPNTGGYYLMTPMPAQAPAPAPGRSPILWILLTALVTGGGIALGWWMFAGRYQFGANPAARAPAARPTPAQPQQTAPPAAPPPQPQPQPQPQPPPEKEPQPPEAAPTSVSAPVTSISAADAVSIMAPMSGQVAKVYLSHPGKVAKGDKLLEVRYETGGANAKKLAARVAELERLAKDDPVYEEFLADARKAQRSARGRSATAVVKATRDGNARVSVEQGEAVAGGKPVAVITGDGDLVIKASAQAEVLRSWTCSVELPDGKRAACQIDKVVASAAGSDITAKVSPKDAPWLEDVSQKPSLVLDPP